MKPEVTYLIVVGPPNSPPTYLVRRAIRTTTVINASTQNNVTENAKLKQKRDEKQMRIRLMTKWWRGGAGMDAMENYRRGGGGGGNNFFLFVQTHFPGSTSNGRPLLL